MTKKIYIKVAVFLVVINIVLNSNIFATGNEINEDKNEINNIESTETINKTDSINENQELTEEEQKQIKELNSIIKELVKTIRTKLKSIDDKFEQIRSLEEYENYPAIRLNIDTPIFGLVSVSNSKLKIKQEVSATDIAKGYSIRYIIKNNTIKIPDKYIAGIIVSTKDVKFDENISLNDANSAVIKLMQYTKTVDNTIEFLNNQVNKIFKGYIDKAKTETIFDIERKLTKLEENFLKQDSNLNNLYVLAVQEDSKKIYNKEIEKFEDISKRIKSNKKLINNMLISNEELTKVQKDVLELESNMIDFSNEVEEELKNAKENIDIKQVLISTQKEIDERRKLLNEVIEKSVTKKSVKENGNVVDKQNQNESEEVNDNNEEVVSDDKDKNDINNTVEEIINYDVVSKNIIELIQNNILNVLEQKYKLYFDETKEVDESIENKQEDTKSLNDNLNNINHEEKENLLNEIVVLYKDYITKENKFYQDNINYTLKNTTSKISDLSKYTKNDILEQMRYIYLEIPTSLESYIDNNNLSSTIEVKKMSNSLKDELNKLIKVYMDVSKIYDELNVNEIKNNA